MSSKKIFWINLAFYLLFPVAGLILWLIALISGGELKNEEYYSLVFLELIFLAIGLLYYLGYERFEYREKTQKLFRILAYVFNVAANGFYGLFFITVFTEGGSFTLLHTSFGRAFGYAGLCIAPLFAILRPAVSRLSEDRGWNENVNLIVTLALPFACYLIGVLFLTTSFGVCFIALTIAAFLLKVRLQGEILFYQQIVFNVIFYGALFVFFSNALASIIPLTYKGDHIGSVEELLTFGSLSIGSSFFFYLYYDFFENLHRHIPPHMRISRFLENVFSGIFGKICFWVGIVFSALCSVCCALQFLQGSYVGLSETFRCGFKDALRFAFYLFPVIFALFRWYFYARAQHSDWSDTKKFIVTLIFPIPCYIVAVAALLIGLYYVLIACAIAFVVLVFFSAKGSYWNSAIGSSGYYGDSSYGGNEESGVSGYLSLFSPYIAHAEWRSFDYDVDGEYVTITGVVEYDPDYPCNNSDVVEGIWRECQNELNAHGIRSVTASVSFIEGPYRR